MGFFDRNKALIITVLLFGITVLGLVNIHLRNSDNDLAATLINLEDFELLEPEKEEPSAEPQEPTPAPKPTSVATHQAYNQDQQESEDLDARLQEIFERNSAESQEAESEETASSSGEFSITKRKREEKKKLSEGDNTSEKVSTRPGTLKNSSISFSLVGRSAVDIPNPIYTCDRSGKVVINISVNADGSVISTSVNKGSSTTDNECLTNKALEYAAGAVFSRMPGKNSQPGTITYNFQG